MQIRRFLKDTQHWPPEDLLAGEVDITFSFTPTDIRFIDAGAPVAILAAAHTGCVELVASKDRIRSTRDLKGKTVGIDTDTQVFISMFAAYVGLDPQKDINWVPIPVGRLGTAFHPREDRCLHVQPPTVAGTAAEEDRACSGQHDHRQALVSVFLLPDRQHQGVRPRNPVATKRALRAILKSVDMCASDPSRVARFMADRGLGSYDMTLQGLREIPFGKWREIDRSRFLALLGSADARRWSDQEQPAADHCARHGLPVPQRVEEGAEGVMHLTPTFFRQQGRRFPHPALSRRERDLFSTWSGRPTMLVAAFLAALALPCGVFAHNAGKDSRLPKIGPAPEFTLTDQDGKPFSLRDLRGKVAVVTFIFTTCSDTCPLLTAKLIGVQKRLGPDQSKVFFTAITVDPLNDTPPVLKKYAQAHSADLSPLLLPDRIAGRDR